MKPFDFWLQAKRLLQDDKSPAGCRTSISRSYYAAFLTARDLLTKVGAKLPTGRGENDHKNVSRVLSSCGSLETAILGVALGNMRSVRTDADYELGEKYVEESEFAESQNADAEEIIAKLNTIGSSTQKCAEIGPLLVKFADALRLGTSP